MKLLLTMALAAFGWSASAQTSETRQVKPFTKIDAKNGIEVIFTQEDAPSLKVESDSEEFLSTIVTEFNNGTLKIYLDENGNKSHGTAKVYVSQKQVSSFYASTGAAIRSANTINVEKLDISLSSGASFTGVIHSSSKCKVKAATGSSFRSNLTAAAFEGMANSGATIRLTGQADSAEIRCTGGILQAGKLISKRAKVIASNAASVYISASEYISAEADNSSSITYYGDPAEVVLSPNTYAVKRDNYKFALN